VEHLRVRPEPGRSPVFQAMFNLHSLARSHGIAALVSQKGHNAAIDFGGLSLEPYFFPQEEGQFELALETIEAGDVLACTFRYQTELFRRETVERIRQSFQTLLADVLDRPDALVHALQVLPPEERQKLLVDWNQTGAEYPREALAHQLFEAQVERTPDATAVIFEDAALTYHELNTRANQLAYRLRESGVAADDRVGIFLERSLEMVVAVLGVLKSGAAYVPMDPIYPPQRIQMMIEDSQMRVLVSQQSLLDALPEHNAELVLVDADRARLDAMPKDNPAPAANSENLAYVIFTSGSTGRPKGVQIAHRALVNFLCAMQREPGIQQGDALGAVTTLSFDIAGLEVYLPLVSGARTVILSSDTAADGIALAEAIERHGITMLQATPVTWRLLMETGWQGRRGLKVLCGGETLDAGLAQRLNECGGELWNLYGPTETTIWSTLARVFSTKEGISIGRPIANTQVYVLDAHRQPVPVGVTGLMYIGGDGLARGYLNQPEMTAEKFIPHPFQPEGRIYNTGDLARYLPDGRIECLGRADNQVKLRGFRIELGEIEALLNQHPALRQAVVIVREDTPGEKRLVAYFTSDNPPSARELSKFLRGALPAYMIPAAYVPLEAFPLTPNGKVNRKALPAPALHSAESVKAIQPPTTPTESLIAGIWEQVLNVQQVSVFDNFFDLGGHSLLAMRVVVTLQEKTGFRLDPAYLRFETLGQLANRVDEALRPA
jgi:amino acid adenylation domain-containing protein